MKVADTSLSEENQANLAELVRACCTACMFMQAGYLDFDFATIFQQPFAARGNLNDTLQTPAACSRPSGRCDLSFRGSSPHRETLMPSGHHDVHTQTWHSAHLRMAMQCMPGATKIQGCRPFQNFHWQSNRQEHLDKLLSDVVSRCVADIQGLHCLAGSPAFRFSIRFCSCRMVLVVVR